MPDPWRAGPVGLEDGVGFYYEMTQAPGTPEFTEGKTPGVFWTLYAFLGFALLCMGLAAYSLLGDLFRSGDWFDKLLVWTLYACGPFYLLTGVWLAACRRFVRASGPALVVGRKLGKIQLWARTLPKASIAAVELLNRKPAANYAPQHHDDSQYFIKGHWRLVAWKKAGGYVSLDKHTEREMLVAMEAAVAAWLRN